MLNQHQNLILPESEWLKIGDCVLDVPRREVSGPCRTTPMRITLKALQVLMVLVGHHGRVVPREAIFEWVWPDTMPTDDVLTQAIAQLRKAFCDDRESPRYVETIARNGYRLMASVHWLDGPVEAASAEASSGAMSPTAAMAGPSVQRHGWDARLADETDASVAGAGAAIANASGALAVGAGAASVAGGDGADGGSVSAVPPAIAGGTATDTAPRAGTPVARRPGASRPIVVAAALVLGVAALAVAVGIARRAQAPPIASQAAPAAAAPLAIMPAAYERITSLPGSEYWPTASPDGGQVAYSAFSEDGKTASLMVQSAAPVPARALTEAVPGTRDVMPAWSPDGQEILFARLGMDDSCQLLLIPSTGGDARTLGTCLRDAMTGYSWHPDGRRLVAAGMSGSTGTNSAIHVMDLASGHWRPLAYDKGAADVDLSPVYSPDGKWIAFQRNISLADVWRMPASGGRPQRLTRLKTNLYGLAWTPDSRSIVFAGYRDASTALLRLEVGSGRVSDLQVKDAVYPGIGAKATSMAFVLASTTSGLYAVDVPGTGRRTPAVPVFPSTGKDLLPSVSPDGTRIAFISDRSGRTALWWAAVDRPDSLRLVEGLHPVARYAAVWSADGERLLAIGRDGDATAVYEVGARDARVRRLPVPSLDPIHAEYLPDPTRMLVIAGHGGGRLELVLYDTRATPWRRLAAIDDVVLARVDRGGRRVLFTRPVQPGLWQADLDLRNVRLLDADPGMGAGRRLIIDGDALRLASSDEACGLRWESLGTAGKASTTAPCLHEPQLGGANFSLDRVHRRLFFSSEVEEGSDIGWMPLPTLSVR